MPVAVVTDSTHYMPRELVSERAVSEVSLYVTRGDDAERELDIADLDAFYAGLREQRDLPSTSQPSPGDFLAVYEPLLEAGYDVVSLHLAGGISGTVETARQAAGMATAAAAGRRIEVVDSRLACGALALPVLTAAACAAGGGDVDAVRARAQETIDSMLRKFVFAVDTLEYLRRGGRIGAAQAFVGGALKIKPILTLDGEITPIERVRTSRRAFERMLKVAEQLRADGSTAWVVQHIQAPDEAQRLAAAAEEIIGTPPLFVSEIGPVIGAHVGPGLLGVGGIRPELLRQEA
ncbi:DegV family protein [Patulibacter sp. SYSU D01012]|uniref:DegV family protein n=1 Tax=Patulibacter sp. SYSU D01012 TaxID=2817381 RepID=UPI001B30EB1E|nr:DegV family protein [Patulibacter sp. SYSU D01012]